MIGISDKLNEYLCRTTRLEGQYVRAEITTKSGIIYSITDDELNGGSVKLNKKSVSGSSFDIGECYINNVTLTIIDKSNKYSESLDNAELKLFFGVVNTDLELNEEIQLGTFIIPTDTTVRKIASLQIVGDSVLSKLDLPISSTLTSGTLYALASWCCDECGLEMALTEAEFNALSENTIYTYYISSDTSIETYRDVIMYISQIIGGFATDTNDGKLTFKTYKTTNDTFNINNDTVASSKLGDSSYKLDGLSINFNGNIIFINGDVSSDYLLELDSNPLFDKLSEDLVNIIGNNIWNQIKDIEFRSFSYDYNGNPALECGDIVTNNERGVSSFLTSLSWTYHGKSSIVGSVLDKRTKTKYQSIKKAATTGGGGSKEQEDIGVYKYINTVDYVLYNYSSVNVASMFVNIKEKSRAIMLLTTTLYSDASGNIEVITVYDGIELLYKQRFNIQKGFNTINLSRSFDEPEVYISHSVSVYMIFYSDDESLVCKINKYNMEINIFALGLSSGNETYSGYYTLSDRLNTLMIGDNIFTNTIDDNIGIYI